MIFYQNLTNNPSINSNNNNNSFQPALNKPLEEIDTDESVEQEPLKQQPKVVDVLENKEKFTEIPFMPKWLMKH